MRRLAAACAAAAVAAACVPVSSPPASSDPGDVRFELAGPGGAALVVPVAVNGAGPFPFVLDTGATLTCIDESLADELELQEPVGTVGFGGTLRGLGRVRLVSIDSLQVGTAAARDLRGCVIDLGAMRGAGLDVRGLLGLNFLKAYRVVLDFADRTLRLETPAAPGRPAS